MKAHFYNIDQVIILSDIKHWCCQKLLDEFRIVVDFHYV